MPAILDGMIVVNKVMHNTLWVPGHFHMYLLIGQVAMAWGFMAWLTRGKAEERLSGANYLGFVIYLAGGLGVTIGFLVAGAASIPRRWAVHAAEWMSHDRVAVVFAVAVLLGASLFFARFVGRILTTQQE